MSVMASANQVLIILIILFGNDYSDVILWIIPIIPLHNGDGLFWMIPFIIILDYSDYSVWTIPIILSCVDYSDYCYYSYWTMAIIGIINHVYNNCNNHHVIAKVIRKC